MPVYCLKTEQQQKATVCAELLILARKQKIVPMRNNLTERVNKMCCYLKCASDKAVFLQI